MGHCVTCTCQVRASAYHTPCPGCGFLTANSFLAKRPGLCEGCAQHYYKEHPYDTHSCNPRAQSLARLRRIG